MAYKTEAEAAYNATALAETLPQYEKQYYISPAEKEPPLFYRAVKRTADITASLMGLVILAVPMAVIAAVVAADSPGSPIYSQERLGKNGKPFTIYKFRTMRLDAEKSGPRWAKEDDERCTKTGRTLRHYHLDELPQLWNILKGDMSFVGPRPERPCFYEEFEEYIHGFRNRLAVRPGLTGLAQVNGGYELLPEEKIVFDMEYIKNRSIKMDLSCIFATIRNLFKETGAR